MHGSIADIRKDYKLKTLSEEDVADSPFPQFSLWWNEAISSEIAEPNAMTLATCTPGGKPSARIVLLKGFSEEGFAFYTNYESRKALELQNNNQAALVFFWKELERQVRIEGLVTKLSAGQSDEYFQSRPQESKIGAWSSPQSQIIASRVELDELVMATEAKFSGQAITRPPFWGGYNLKPLMIEFWQGRSNRLHDRIAFFLNENKWSLKRLAP